MTERGAPRKLKAPARCSEMKSQEISSSNRPDSIRFLPVLLILFIGSGCAALIYEIVWLQLLQLVIGLSSISLGVLLGTFMGGMCLGSYFLPRIIPRGMHPLVVYALLELGIGAIGIAVLNGMPYVERIYSAVGGVESLVVSIMLRSMVAALFLIPPTLLMGATLPAIARWVETTPQGVSWLGFFYGGNIVGAVAGCLLAGFYLLRVHDMAYATYVAVAINAVVAVVAIGLSRIAPHQVRDSSLQRKAEAAPGARAVYVTIALSGMCALAAEVVWTRLMSLMFGASVYTFSIILAVFLVGLGIGSSFGSFLARSVERPRIALGICQFLVVVAVAWTATMVTYSLPYWPINPGISSSPWYTFQMDIARCMWATLPATILWGASFPLALAAVSTKDQDGGKLVGGVYAANTVGAIVGALLFSMVVVPMSSTVGAQRLIIAITSVSAILVLLPERRRFTGPAGGEITDPIGAGRAVALFAGVVVAAILAWTVTAVPWGVVAYGRYVATWVPQLALKEGTVKEEDVPTGSGFPDIYDIFVKEGMNVSVAVTKTKAGVRSFHGAGKVQASSDPQDMRLQRMLGAISAFAVKNPENVLVVACGAGVTAGSFVPFPEVKHITIVDIETVVPNFVAPMFKKENYNVRYDPRTVVKWDDGRHFIRTTKEKFDVITSDPIDPWVKGCAALNTVEYYQMCKDHLKPGGVMSLWIPIYESNSDTFKSVLSTFFKVFPNGVLWSNDIGLEGYDAVLFGMNEPIDFDLDELQARFMSDGYAKVRESLFEVGFFSIPDLFATYAGHPKHLEPWLRTGQINTDRNLRLQYLAGMWLNSYMGKAILGEVLGYFESPDEFFHGSPAIKLEFNQALIRLQRPLKLNMGSTPLAPSQN